MVDILFVKHVEIKKQKKLNNKKGVELRGWFKSVSKMWQGNGRRSAILSS